MLGDIDDRLHRWARWALSGRPQLGLASETPIYEMVRSGVISHGSGLRTEAEAPEEETTEAGVRWLIDRHALEGHAICLHYLGRGRPEQKARDLGVARSEYFQLVKIGKYCLEAWLDARLPSPN